MKYNNKLVKRIVKSNNCIFKSFLIRWSSTWSQNIRSLYFDFNNFDLNIFTQMVLDRFNIGVTYSLLLKLRYEANYYGMGGGQIGFKLSSVNDLESINSLYYDLKNKIRIFEEMYNVEEVEIIQILYIEISDMPKLKLQNINHIKLNKEFLKVKEARSQFGSTFLPLTMNSNYYGKLLPNDSLSTYINLINNQS